MTEKWSHRKINPTGCIFLAALVTIYACAAPGLSRAQTAYYQGKTVTILRGGTPGGYGDLQTRALLPYLKKYIPGEPTVIIEHKQGAAGRTAINYIYAGAKPDGLTIGAVGNVLVSGPVLGLAGSNYDLDKLIYLGSTESGSPTAFVTEKRRDSTAWISYAPQPAFGSAPILSATSPTSTAGSPPICWD